MNRYNILTGKNPLFYNIGKRKQSDLMPTNTSHDGSPSIEDMPTGIQGGTGVQGQTGLQGPCHAQDNGGYNSQYTVDGLTGLIINSDSTGSIINSDSTGSIIIQDETGPSGISETGLSGPAYYTYTDNSDSINNKINSIDMGIKNFDDKFKRLFFILSCLSISFTILTLFFIFTLL